MKRTMMLIAAGLMSWTSAGAQAQATGMQLNMDSGFYLGAGVGKSRTGDGCFGVCDTTSRSWNVSAGYQVNPYFALEAGYADLGEAVTSGTLVGVPVTARLETTVIEFVGVGMLPITDAFSFYAKAGIYRYDTDSSTTGAAVGTSSETGAGFTFAGGLQYSFTRNIAARLEWQSYSDVGTGVSGLEKDDVIVWRLGARYKF